MSSLHRNLANIGGIYHVPNDDLVGEVLIPGMSAANEVRVGAGFFSSYSFAQIAPGLAEFLKNSKNPIRMLMSPVLSDEDARAIEAGVLDRDGIISKAVNVLFDDAFLSPSKVVQHVTECLAYLIAADRLQLKVVLYPDGSYHRKIWLFNDGTDLVAIHGSGNATYRGLVANGEQMTIDCTWWGESIGSQRIRRIRDVWEQQWRNQDDSSVTVEVPAVIEKIRYHVRTSGKPPTTEDFWRAWGKDYKANLAIKPSRDILVCPNRRLVVPEGLIWTEGRYAHQSRAIEAFEANHNRGILAIATGGGKTKTALIAATRAQDRHEGPTLVVILVPSKPLQDQWTEEVKFFGLEPINPSFDDLWKRKARLQEIRAALSVATPHTEVLIVVNALMKKDPGIREFIDSCGTFTQTFLIADEVHNLGAASTVNDLPERFDCRLGLSATPIRQYDPIGTSMLMNYFGGEIFKFSLEEAINSGCLVPYNYLLHDVELNDTELIKYDELSAELSRLGYLFDDSKEGTPGAKRVQQLLFARRSILEHAEEKLAKLRDLLMDYGPANVRRTLVYASAKSDPLDRGRQIDKINLILRELDVRFHQFTNKETTRSDAAAHLDRFATGQLQVLTAMKVLDEGVDLPETDTAFVLASSTVEREWAQRRGRILRAAPGKASATLHDFFVVPSNLNHPSSIRILKTELRRVNAFASLAINEFSPGGPRSVTREYEKIVYPEGAYED